MHLKTRNLALKKVLNSRCPHKQYNGINQSPSYYFIYLHFTNDITNYAYLFAIVRNTINLLSFLFPSWLYDNGHE
jgi:hypothetical protein